MSKVDDEVDSTVPEAGSPATAAETPSYTARRIAGFLVPLAGQALILFVLLTAYKMGRRLSADEVSVAFRHAAQVWRFERWVHFPSEVAVQGVILHWPALVRAANRFYMSVHFPAIVIFLLWCYVRKRHAYPRVRNVLIMLTGSALVIHIVYPLAPPRMIGHGLVDTAAVFGPSPYANADVDKVLNQYAAMPSLHIGWALLICWAVCKYSTARLRWVFVVYPAIVTGVVVSTANHYWMDGVVAAALLVAAIRLTRWMEGRPVRKPNWSLPPDQRVARARPALSPAAIAAACGALWSGGAGMLWSRSAARRGPAAPRPRPPADGATGFGSPRDGRPPMDDAPELSRADAASHR